VKGVGQASEQNETGSLEGKNREKTQSTETSKRQPPPTRETNKKKKVLKFGFPVEWALSSNIGKDQEKTKKFAGKLGWGLIASASNGKNGECTNALLEASAAGKKKGEGKKGRDRK